MNKHTLYLGCLLIIVFVSFFGIALPYPIMSQLFLSSDRTMSLLNLSPEILYGVALAGYPLGQFCGAPMLGVISDHFGRKTTLVISLSMTCIGYVISIYALVHSSFMLFVLSRLFTGFWEGIFPIARAAAADLQGYISKTKSFGYINTAATLGYLSGPLTGSLLSENNIYSGFHPEVIFWCACALTLLALIVLLFFYEESAVYTGDNSNKNTRFIAQKLKSTWAPLRQKNCLWIIIMSTFITLGFDIYYQFYPLYLFSKWQVNTFDIAMTSMVLSSAIIVMQIFFISICNKLLKVEHTLILFCIAYIICLIALIITNTYNMVLVIFCLLGFCISLIGTNLPVLVSDLTANNIQGQIMGLMMSLRFLGDGILCLIGGAVSSVSVNAPFIIASIFVTLGMSMLLVMAYSSSFSAHQIAEEQKSLS